MVSNHEGHRTEECAASPPGGRDPSDLGEGDMAFAQIASASASSVAPPGLETPPPRPNAQNRSRRPAAAPVLDGWTDLQLAERLRKDGFDGELGRAVVERLMRYGLGVLTAWMNSGVIWDRVPGGGVCNWSETQAIDLRATTVTDAVMAFKKQILEGTWDPARASLRTWFIGGCKFKFADAYRASGLASNKCVPMEDVPNPRMGQDPEVISVQRDMIAFRMKDMDRRLQRILYLRSEDYTIPEIAHLLGVTDSTVEGVLYRYKRKATGEDRGDE
ncbi:helix-turn-helix domain-containing protein [Streptomyces sp. NPDC006733]|uniref:helix-turn-helix domain-containing protein n=1 Tax=Streptomyces sp. NPDC006733 TaxID=3155460 RepID=UPI0033DE0F96